MGDIGGFEGCSGAKGEEAVTGGGVSVGWGGVGWGGGEGEGEGEVYEPM